MNNNQYTYNQPPMGQRMMPPQGAMIPPMQGRSIQRGWRERWMRRFGMDVAVAPLTKGERTIPNWLTGKVIVPFYVACPFFE